MNKPPVIAFILPTGDMVHTDFALSFANVCIQLTAEKIRCCIVNPRTSSIDKSRNSGVQQVLEIEQATHFCFIDSDQMFPASAVVRLLQHKKPIVSAASVNRQTPVHFTARNYAGNRVDFRSLSGLVAVKSNGFSLMLIEREVFEKMQFPWFGSYYFKEEFVSEDQLFCKTAKLYNYDILVDCDLSKEIKHIGQHRFSPEDIK